MVVRKWDRLLLDACKRLSLLAPRILKTIEFSDAPEKLLAAQLSQEDFARLIREASANLPPQVAFALQQPARSVGRFVLVQESGAEARGTHFKGWDKVTGNAVEVVNVPLSADVDFDKLFREASAAANLNHPVFARIMGAEKHTGGIAIGFERASGEPVATGRTSLGFLLPFAREVAYALHESHERGVLHLDLKPSNVLISGIWSPKIRGAGLARALSPGGSAFGRKGLIGTPGYMAPEQARGREEAFGPRTDVYGLGATMYHWLTGQPPLPEEDPVAVLKSGCEPVRLRNVAPRMPKELENIVMKCLLSDPKARYATCREVGEELQRHLASRPVQATTVTMRMRVQRFAQQRKLALVLLLIFVSLATYAVSYYTRLFRQARQEQFYDLVLRIRGEYSAGAFANARDLVEAAAKRDPEDPTVRYWRLRLAIREELAERGFARPVDFEGWLEWIPAPRPPIPAVIREELTTLDQVTGEENRIILQGLRAMLEEEAPPPALLEQCVTAAPWDGEMKLYLGIARLRAGDFAAARAILETLLQGPFQAPARTVLAVSWLGSAIARTEGEGHDSLLDRGLQIQIQRPPADPRDASVTVALLLAKVRLAASQGAFGQAFSLLRRVSEVTESFASHLPLCALRAEAVTLTAEIQSARGLVDEALQGATNALLEFETIGGSLPREPAVLLPWAEAFALRARLHEARQEAGPAVADLTEAVDRLSLLSHRPDASLLRGYLLRCRSVLNGAAENGLREEIEALQRILASKSDYVPALVYRARAAAALAEILRGPASREVSRGALTDLERAVEVSRRHPAAVLALASARIDIAALFESAGAAEEATRLRLDALEDLNRLLSRQPRLAGGLRLRGETLTRLALARAAAGHDPAGIAALVERDFERILETDPDQPDAPARRAEALFRIASAAVAKGRDPAPWVEKIAHDCSQVLRRDSKRTDVLILRGRAYLLHSIGDLQAPGARVALQQAAEDFSQALNARPGNAWLHRLRGESRVHIGLLQRATKEDPQPTFRLAESDLNLALKLDPNLRDQIEPLLRKMR